MRLAVVVPYLNEERHLPALLASLASQTRPCDELLLVDDGSTDAAASIAERFSKEHPYARSLNRPPRPVEHDRLARAAELKAFQWGVDQLLQTPDIVCKMDADLRLPPDLFAEIVRQFERDPTLGITGSYLAVLTPNGELKREYNPPEHVRGPNKFYRWSCYQEIQPVAAHLGWDMVDEVKARMRGWRTQSFEPPSGDALHLRPTGVHDGRLRAYRRWGECAYGYGAHPVHVVAGGIWRFRRRPLVLAGLSYVTGWALAAVRRVPRAEREVRVFVRHEELRAARRRLQAVIRRANLAALGSFPLA